MTYSSLSTTLGVNQGYLNTTSQANKWLHFKLDGKELIVSKVAIRGSISWDHLYSKGLVYGTDDNGINPTVTPINQLRTVDIVGKTYKVRLLKGADTDPLAIKNNNGFDSVGTQNSEWSRLFYPIVIDDNNIRSYTGPKLASYTQAELQMLNISASETPGAFNWCQERYLSSVDYNRVLRAGYSTTYFSINTTSSTSTVRGWRCCLELIS